MLLTLKCGSHWASTRPQHTTGGQVGCAGTGRRTECGQQRRSHTPPLTPMPPTPCHSAFPTHPAAALHLGGQALCTLTPCLYKLKSPTPITPAPPQSLRVRFPRDSQACSFPPFSLSSHHLIRDICGLLPSAWLNPPWSSIRTEHPAWWAYRGLPACTIAHPAACSGSLTPRSCSTPAHSIHIHPNPGSLCFSLHDLSNLPTGLLAASVSLFQSILDFKS